MLDSLLQMDAWLFAALNGSNLGRVGALFFQAVTWLGSVWVVAPLLLLLAATRYRERWRTFVLVFAATLSLGGIIVQSVKAAVDRPRPTAVGGVGTCKPLAQPARTPASAVTLRTSTLCGRSFPSGHTQVAFTWSFLLLAFAGRRYWPFALAISLLVGLSRIYLGVHYPLDVAFGALLGLGLALGAGRFVRPDRRLAG